LIANTPEYVEVEMFVPKEACGQIIGKGGQNIKEMCSLSGMMKCFYFK
jgi:ATPase (PilT family)